MKKFLFILLVPVATACSSALLKPAETDLSRAQEKFPGITLAELQDGRSLYKANCGSCHDLKNPTSRNEDGWNKIIPPMAAKAKIDAKTKDLITKYLITMCSAGAK